MERVTAIYARQSIDKKDSLSIDGQIELCRNEAGAAPVEVYQDRGYSGKNVKRPDFTRLMTDVEAGRINKIICYRLDRISRSISDFGRIWEALSQFDVEFVSVNEKFDTSTPVGRAMLYIIMVFAQLERETIAERIKDNYYQRVRRGTWPGGPAPYGFEIVKNPGAVLCPTSAIDIVPKLFEMYSLQGASLGSVCRWLNDSGIVGAQRPAWDTVSLNRLLRHPAYVKADATVYAYYKAKGLIMANDIDDFDGTHGATIVGKRNASDRKYAHLENHLFALAAHEGIISADLFLKCQTKLDGNKQIKNSGKGRFTWLSGLLKCGECGYGLKVQHDSKTGKLYLVCSGKANLKICSSRHSEAISVVEETVFVQMWEYLQTVASRKKSANADLSALKAELASIDEKIGNLISALTDSSAVTMRYVNAEMLRLDTRKQEILTQLSMSAAAETLELAELAFVEIEALSFERKKVLAQMLIDRVFCTTDSVNIVWKI